MPKPEGLAAIDFKARLLRPVEPDNADWAFLVLPKAASAGLPTRSQVSVRIEFNAHGFEATLQPDGQGSHWLKLDAVLLKASGASVGDQITVSMRALPQQPEPELPDDWARALQAQPEARAVWDDITPIARRDWIAWITSGKKAETRAKRIATACDMLARGKRRACCFDRSGIYSGAFAAPKAAE